MHIKIEKKNTLHQFDIASDEPLLFAGLRAGLPLPYECVTGTCGTCKGRLIDGEIDQGWAEAPGRKNHKESRGEFLMCQAHANSDCAISIPGRIKRFRDDDIVPDYHQGTTSGWEYLTEDVVRFEVMLQDEVSYHPGQFFVIQALGLSGYRAYSMVNYVGKTSILEFVIKLKSGGGFSNWVSNWVSGHGERQGDISPTVSLFGPLGQATFHVDENYDLMMITGGSGIAGLMSILQQAKRKEYLKEHNINLFFGVRTLSDLFFMDRLMALKKDYLDSFSVNIVLSMQQAEGLDISNYPGISFASGMVHERALEEIPSDASNTMIYMAGPQPMIDATIRPLVIDANIPADMIRFDKFT